MTHTIEKYNRYKQLQIFKLIESHKIGVFTSPDHHFVLAVSSLITDWAVDTVGYVVCICY